MLAVDKPGTVEDWIVLIADDRDANANVVLRELGIPPATPAELDVTVVAISPAPQRSGSSRLTPPSSPKR